MKQKEKGCQVIKGSFENRQHNSNGSVLPLCRLLQDRFTAGPQVHASRVCWKHIQRLMQSNFKIFAPDVTQQKKGICHHFLLK